MKYTKKPITVEAVQWFKNGDHPAVEPRNAEIFFDRGGKYFYVTHCDDGVTRPSAWLAVEAAGETAKKHGEELPFAFYELKSGNVCPVADRPELLERYMRLAGWTRAPADRGYIRTLEGGHVVTPGDWIITGVKGEFYPCKPDIFAATYEPDGRWRHPNPLRKLTSGVRRGGPVAFPAFTGERVYMQPFLKVGDEILLPSNLVRWVPTVAAMLKGIETKARMFLMVDQAEVKPGKSHRRPGPHIDGNWTEAKNGDFNPAELLILASDVEGCVAYCGDYDSTLVGDGGDCSAVGLSNLTGRWHRSRRHGGHDPRVDAHQTRLQADAGSHQRPAGVNENRERPTPRLR